MTAELGVLGAGSILPRAGHGCAGYVLAPEGLAGESPVTLLDCGPGSLRALGALGVDLRRVQRVVLSHLHLDHCLDLYALAFARRNPALGRTKSGRLPFMEIVGPAGTVEFLSQIPKTFGFGATDPDQRVTEVELDSAGNGLFLGDLEPQQGLSFWCTRNGHSRSLTTLSWRVEARPADRWNSPQDLVAEPRWSLLYTGDTNEDARVTRLGRRVDLFVAECSFEDEDAQANHLTPSSAARMARDAGAHHLLLSHFYPSADPERCRKIAADHFGSEAWVSTARDGSVHPIRRERTMGG